MFYMPMYVLLLKEEFSIISFKGMIRKLLGKKPIEMLYSYLICFYFPITYFSLPLSAWNIKGI